jgi:hypothetical protein
MRPIGLGGTRFLGKHFRIPGVSLWFLNQAAKVPIDFIDTAPMYGNGRSESLIGRSISLRNVRVISKVGQYYRGMDFTSSDTIRDSHTWLKCSRDELWEIVFAPRSLVTHLSASLTRLRRQKIFGYLLHDPPSGLPLSLYVDSLRTLKRCGLVHYVGLSLDRPVDMDISWVDILQVPLGAVSSLRSPNDFKICVVNSIFKSSQLSTEEAAKVIAGLPKNYWPVQGSGSLKHIESFRHFLRQADGFFEVSSL